MNNFGILILNGGAEPIYPPLTELISERLRLFDIPHIFSRAKCAPPLRATMVMGQIESDAYEQEGYQLFMASIEGFKFLRANYPSVTHIVRTNLSSIFDLISLKLVVDGLPRETCYAGAPCGIRVQQDNSDFIFRSGAAITLSVDLVDFLIANSLHAPAHFPDDVIIGYLLRSIHQIQLPMYTITDLHPGAEEFFDHMVAHIKQINELRPYHIRLKNLSGPKRLAVDLPIANFLWKMINMKL